MFSPERNKRCFMLFIRFDIGFFIMFDKNELNDIQTIITENTLTIKFKIFPVDDIFMSSFIPENVLKI